MVAFPHSKYREFPRALAEQVRQEYPALWARHGTGGNPPTAFTGDHAYMLWGLWLAGDTSPEVRDWALRRREAYATRHRKDFRKGGIIAAIKWGVVLPIGLPAMMDELEQTAAKSRRRTNAPEPREPQLRLELACGQSTAPRGHLGKWNPQRDEAHPKHLEVARLAAHHDIDTYVEAHTEGPDAYSDAYLYFTVAQLPMTVEILRAARYKGDILDQLVELDPVSEALARAVAAQQGWALGDGFAT